VYRIQRDEINLGRRASIDVGVFTFVCSELRRCAAQSDPLSAVEAFLEGKRPARGRPKTPHRDFVIAGDIEESVDAGATIDAACQHAACRSNKLD
jgi:hypothetical protein